MKPTIKLKSAQTPDGGELSLYEHDNEYFITIDRHELMSSREHESELELARLGCERLTERKAPTVLIGGLGMGYTLRQTLDMLHPRAKIIVAELMPEVVRWNRDILGKLNDHPLRDKRVTIEVKSVEDIIRRSNATFDAILLDVDNGPEAMTDSANNRLYSSAGIRACAKAINAKGCLAVWSASKDISYEKRLRRQQLHVRAFHVPKRRGGKSRPRCIWVASKNRNSLPQREQPDYRKQD
jgi:spermidine synthase